MKSTTNSTNRRHFLRSGALFATGVATAGLMGFNRFPGRQPGPADDGLYMIGPREGYTPYIGSLVSMLNYNRSTILGLTKGMTMEQLDHLQDPQSNTIGALLMHLACVDKYYYMNTFEKRNDFNEEEKKQWDPSLELGDKGRASIKGHELAYYTDLLTTNRAKTLEGLKTKDDAWLLAYDPDFSKDPKFNNYWKWFHVCEHESHHRGQIAWLKKRIPGMKSGQD